MVVVENAGVPEVNGDYHFCDLKNNAGYYSRSGSYKEKESKFTLYKCSLRNGGFQWFISITPEGMEPGTTNDIDFYFAPAKVQDYLPPTQWNRLSAQHTRDPAPRVRLVRVKNDEDEDGNDEDELLPGLENELTQANLSNLSDNNPNDSDSVESDLLVADETVMDDSFGPYSDNE
jgi:hypothetical protein